MDKFLTKRPRVSVESSSGSVRNYSQGLNNNVVDDSGVVFRESDIVSDPGLRKSIDSFDVNIRDRIRREYVAKGPCQPRGHDFPKTKYGIDNRGFRDVWYDDYAWLEYSMSKDAAYCFWCFLFKRGSLAPGDEAFANSGSGFRNWKKAHERFRAHVGSTSSAHKKARIEYENFLNQKQSLSYVVERGSTLQDKTYLIRLTASLDVIRYCLGEGLAFRGHDESSTSLRPGHFLSLLRWYRERKEEVGNVTFENAPGNCQMTSPPIQKDLINACAVETRLKILDELGDGLFSIMVDESRDCSIKEQMAIVIRFVNKKGEVMERFLYLVHVKETTSISLKEGIDFVFSELGLSLSRLRGQGYDGASNMRGEYNGLKTLILKENPTAWYVHCFAHQLQLVCVSIFTTNPHIGSFFCYLGDIVTVAGSSCKRADRLRQLEHDRMVERIEKGEIGLGRGQNQETSLRRPGDTRWGSHYTTIIRLEAMWPSTVKVVENVLTDGVDAKAKAKALGLLQNMQSYAFVFAMFLMKNLLGIIPPLSLALQEKDQNILNAINEIVAVKEKLQMFRDSGWDDLRQEVDSFCEANDIDGVKMNDILPRLQRIKRDGLKITNYHHYRVEVFCEVVDAIIQDMNDRFSESSTQLLECMACLDPRNQFSNFNVEKLIQLVKLYPKDYTSMELLMMQQELQNFVISMRTDARFVDIEDLSSLSKKMVETMKDKLFPLVYRLIELVLLLPVATATVERAFSAMKYVKSELQSRMKDKCLNDCLLVYIEKELFVNIPNERILRRFQDMDTRRRQLPNLTGSSAT